MKNRYARRENFGHPIRNPLLRQHFVYRAFAADGYLLYVGCSYTPDKRFAAHRSSSCWFDEAVRFTMSGPYNYETARHIEHVAINSERPQYNYTAEKRTIDKTRDRMINREISARIDRGESFTDALAPAVDAVHALLPYVKHDRITDLMVPNARRIERDHMQALAERGAA